MFIFGDSHVRSYATSKYISHAIFLGPGKDINFVSWIGVINVLISFFSVNGVKKTDYVMVIGEPDVRNATFGDWYVHDNSKSNTTRKQEKKIKRSLRRVEFFIYILRYFNVPPKMLIGAASPDNRLQHSLVYFNKRLRIICENANIKFFDPNRIFISCTDKNELIGYSVFKRDVTDMTHLSQNIGSYFDAEFMRISECIQHDMCNVDDLNTENLKFISEFRCYSYTPKGLNKIVLKGNRLLRKIMT